MDNERLLKCKKQQDFGRKQISLRSPCQNFQHSTSWTGGLKRSTVRSALSFEEGSLLELKWRNVERMNTHPFSPPFLHGFWRNTLWRGSRDRVGIKWGYIFSSYELRIVLFISYDQCRNDIRSVLVTPSWKLHSAKLLPSIADSLSVHVQHIKRRMANFQCFFFTDHNSTDLWRKERHAWPSGWQ